MYNTLTCNQYMRGTDQTAIYRGADSANQEALMYVALGLAGEAGEVADLVKKWYRDGELNKELLYKEAGDVAWYLARICRHMGWDLGGVLEDNLRKLSDRQERGVLGGNGDER